MVEPRGRVAMSEQPYDSVVVISFGGPEKPEDVIPFLENVVRGRNVPRERMLEVAEHYYHLGGSSPINEQNRRLTAALAEELRRSGPDLPVYWGNRNWHPLLAGTLRQMRAASRKRALGFVTSAFSSYSGCRQYLEDIERARAEIGEGAPTVDKLRVFYNHPVFIEILTAHTLAAFARIPDGNRERARLLFTAHSIPLSMARTSDYRQQLEEVCRLVADESSRPEWRLVYQSRSGPPQQPWLGPDIGDALREIRGEGAADVVVVPIGFLSDHMEVLYDLDTEARAIAEEIGLNLVRAATPGSDPRFITMLRELIAERIGLCAPRAVGRYGTRPDFCPADCCPGVAPTRTAPQFPASTSGE